MSDLGLACMLALEDYAPLDLFGLRRAVAQVAPRSTIQIERRRTPPGESALFVEFDGQPFVVHASQERMPEAEYKEAVAGNLFWPEAGDAMARHSACVTVCGAIRQRGHGLVRAQAIALTRLAASVSLAYQAVGVHWLGTRAMASPSRLSRAAEELGNHLWPVDLWLGYVHFGTDRPGEQLVIGVQTVGAKEYLGFEIEVPQIPVVDKIEPIRILFGAVGYLIAHGRVIEDGKLVEVQGERLSRWRLHLGKEDAPGLAQLTVVEGQ
ncbi:MAG: hypothetical protein AAFU49_03665 [Pseudomonadota bacterium]